MTRLLKFSRAGYCALAENAQHQFAARYAQCHFRSDTVYSFIPKNCCTTMRYSLALENGCIAGAEDFEWLHQNNRTFSASLRELQTARYTFTILRDPASRLASAYLDKMIRASEDAPKYHVAHFLKASGFPAAELDSLTFRRFCEALRDDVVLRCDPHWRPQGDFLVFEDYDQYFAAEQFSAAVPEIEQRTGMTIRDARALSRHGTDQYHLQDGEGFADTPLAALREMKRGGALPAHAALYDQALLELVRAVYAEDCQLIRDRLGQAG